MLPHVMLLAAALLAVCVVFHVAHALVDARRRSARTAPSSAAQWPTALAALLLTVAFLVVAPASRTVEAIPALLGIGIAVVASRWLIYPAVLNALRGIPASYVTDVRVAHDVASERALISLGLVRRDYVPFEGERRTRHVYLLTALGWLFKLVLLAVGLGSVVWSSTLM
ncbi:MAG: hypothetical protein AAGG50_21045 [Bacteroidota bacterium]